MCAADSSDSSSSAVAARCAICGGETRASPAVRGIVECVACGHGLLHPPPTDAELAHSYAGAYGEDGAKFRGIIERVVARAAQREARAVRALLPVECQTVLDVGCGRGL